LFGVITPSERFNNQREMDKGAEHHIDLREQFPGRAG
jgi:hypothetical protein